MSYLLDIAIAVIQAVLSFYTFWLIWRVLLPWLPGPEEVRKRIAPYACFFTDPFVMPVVKGLRLPVEFVSFLALLLLVALQVGLKKL